MADAFQNDDAEYLRQSLLSWKSTLESLESLVKTIAATSATSASTLTSTNATSNSPHRTALEEWKTVVSLQKCQLEEAYERSLSSMRLGKRLAETTPLSLKLDSLNWQRLVGAVLTTNNNNKKEPTNMMTISKKTGGGSGSLEESVILQSCSSSSSSSSLPANNINVNSIVNVADAEQFEIVRPPLLIEEDAKAVAGDDCDDFVCVVVAASPKAIAANSTASPPEKSNSAVVLTTTAAANQKGAEDADDDADFCEAADDDSVGEDWSSDISLISSCSNNNNNDNNNDCHRRPQGEDVLHHDKNNGTNSARSSEPANDNSNRHLLLVNNTSEGSCCAEAVAAAFTGEETATQALNSRELHSELLPAAPSKTVFIPPPAAASDRLQQLDLKQIRDRIMARFQLHQRFGHHLARDVCFECLRRALDRDQSFAAKPLPYIYETIKSILPVALESAKSKYQAPQVSGRLMAQWTFKTKLCLPFSVNGPNGCPNGNKCPYAHGPSELRSKRRVALCHQWEERGYCQRRSVCLYAHGRAELGKEIR